jgi:hypothetical protein
METTRFSETSVLTRATQHHIAEDGIHSRRRDNLKPCKKSGCCCPSKVQFRSLNSTAQFIESPWDMQARGPNDTIVLYVVQKTHKPRGNKDPFSPERFRQGIHQRPVDFLFFLRLLTVSLDGLWAWNSDANLSITRTWVNAPTNTSLMLEICSFHVNTIFTLSSYCSP